MSSKLIEPLERRRLFAVTFDVADPDGSPFAHLTKSGTLVFSGQITGDTMQVETSKNGKRILAAGIGPFIGNFSAREVKRVLVEGGGGQDKIVTNNLNRPATLVGGTGNDILQGGYRSTLIGGDGNDKLIVKGPDKSFGIGGTLNIIRRGDGTGRFEIISSSGDTILYNTVGSVGLNFATGPSLLSGGAGNDTFSTGGSQDSVIGGAGADTFSPTGQITFGLGADDVEGIGELSGVEKIAFSMTTP